jgi:hypothetical protein
MIAKEVEERAADYPIIFLLELKKTGSRDSVVGIATGYGLDE